MYVLALMDIVKVLLEVELDINLKILDQTVYSIGIRSSELEYEEQNNKMAKALSNILTDTDIAFTEVSINFCLNQDLKLNSGKVT